MEVLACGLVVVMDAPVVVRLAFWVVALVVLKDDAERGGCDAVEGCPRERWRDEESGRVVVDDVEVGSGRGISLEDDGPGVGACTVADGEEREPRGLEGPALLEGECCPRPVWLVDGSKGGLCVSAAACSSVAEDVREV